MKIVSISLQLLVDLLDLQTYATVYIITPWLWYLNYLFSCYICFSQQEKHLATLEGHIGQVNCAEFCPHYTSTLVTVGDDRTFKVSD